MTTDKAFKRVVRARMAKTGERYAAARRSLLASADAAPDPDATKGRDDGASTYRMRGGLHPETATLANVLANQGVVSGLSGKPLSEAAILGIGGGLGAGYILWEFKSREGAILTLGFRNRWQYPWIPGWTGKTLERLGIEADRHETGGAKGAQAALDARLDAGAYVIASVDLRGIDTWGLPDALWGYCGHTVVIVGRDRDGSYIVDDRGRAPFRVPPEVMAAARGRIGSFKNRIVGLRTTPGPIPAERLRAAMRAGLDDQVDHLRSPSDSFSLPAWRKWGRLMTDTRNAKAWPRVFAGGHGLFDSLLRVLESVDGDVGPWGGHLRELYAASLDEAAGTLENPALERCGAGLAQRRRPVGGARRCGGPTRPGRCRRRRGGRRAAARGGHGRRTGPCPGTRGGRDRLDDPRPLRRRLPAAGGSGRGDPRRSRRTPRCDLRGRGGRAGRDGPSDRPLRDRPG